jgi:hypothetical protein
MEKTHMFTRIGFVFLILASLWRQFAPRAAFMPPDLVDGSTGLLYGICFACLLIGLRTRSRQRHCVQAPPM